LNRPGFILLLFLFSFSLRLFFCGIFEQSLPVIVIHFIGKHNRIGISFFIYFPYMDRFA